MFAVQCKHAFPSCHNVLSFKHVHLCTVSDVENISLPNNSQLNNIIILQSSPNSLPILPNQHQLKKHVFRIMPQLFGRDYPKYNVLMLTSVFLSAIFQTASLCEKTGDFYQWQMQCAVLVKLVLRQNTVVMIGRGKLIYRSVSIKNAC